MKKIILLLLLVFLFLPTHAYAKKVKIMLDPGHGGKLTGGISYDGEVAEKDINLKIGLNLKKILEKEFEDVEVHITRLDDKAVSLEQRVRMGKEYDCDCVISLHNNFISGNQNYDNGATILVPSGNNGNKEIAKKTWKLGANILLELEQLGLKNRGLLIRITPDQKAKYPNGERMDYYNAIKYGSLYEIPSIVIEHAFIDNKSDYNNFLKTDEEIYNLSYADAIGIARYFRLKEKSTEERLEPIGGYNVKITTMTTNNWTDVKTEKKMFYQYKEVPETPTPTPAIIDDEMVESVKPLEEDVTKTTTIPKEMTEIKVVEKPEVENNKIKEDKVEEVNIKEIENTDYEKQKTELEKIRNMPMKTKINIIVIILAMGLLIGSFIGVIKYLQR